MRRASGLDRRRQLVAATLGTDSADAGRQLAHHGQGTRQVGDIGDEHGQAGRDECIVVLDAVLFPVEHDEVRRERDDRLDVGVLGTTDVGDVRLFTELRTGDHVATEREQRLGRRGHQTHDTHR